MKKRINIQLMAIVSVAIFATILLISVVFYDLYQKQIMDDLKSYAELLEDMNLYYEIRDDIELKTTQVRITLISEEGNVQFDTEADIAMMDNHGDRKEVRKALESGEGTSIRASATIGKNTFYYAKKMGNGTVLRVAKEAGSIMVIYKNAMPFVSIMIVLLLVFCGVVSRFMTKRLLTPLEQMTEIQTETQDVVAYEELQPLLLTIKQQHEDIMKTSLLRQEFTANVSHELKTPLTAISGYAELIETGMASEADVQRFAKGIHKNSNRLLSLINDIIRLSELDSDTAEVAVEPLNLYMMAQTCVDMLQFSAEQNKVKLNVEGSDCYIERDRQMMDELLYNLCDNAIRYNNENGSVLVSVNETEEHVILKVKDTGIGIPKDAQDRVFERFYRVDKSRSKSTGGTGLGLAIVKHIIAKANAEILLESEEGVGTEITVLFHKKVEAI